MKAVHALIIVAGLIGGAPSLFQRKHVVVERSSNWSEAQTFCRTNYTDLSTIDSPEEFQQFVYQTGAHAGFSCWIGLSKNPDATSFTRWSDGSNSTFGLWDVNEPNNLRSERCVCTYNYLWHDVLCHNLMNFFCYTWEPRPVVVREMKTWTEALKYCRTFYNDLISVTSRSDLLAIDNPRSIQTPRFWTGLRFMGGSWFWVNGDPLGSLVSMPSCPVRPLHCGARRNGSGVWENRDCEEKMNFVCY